MQATKNATRSKPKQYICHRTQAGFRPSLLRVHDGSTPMPGHMVLLSAESPQEASDLQKLYQQISVQLETACVLRQNYAVGVPLGGLNSLIANLKQLLAKMEA